MDSEGAICRKIFLPRCISSKKAIAENPEHLTAAKRAFIVTGKHGAKASGALSDVTAVLDGAGIPYSVFDGVTENPSVGSAYRAGNEARAFGADTVIGIGRGQRDRCCKGDRGVCRK